MTHTGIGSHKLQGITTWLVLFLQLFVPLLPWLSYLFSGRRQPWQIYWSSAEAADVSPLAPPVQPAATRVFVWPVCCICICIPLAPCTKIDFHSSWFSRQSTVYDRQLSRLIYKEKPTDNLCCAVRPAARAELATEPNS